MKHIYRLMLVALVSWPAVCQAHFDYDPKDQTMAYTTLGAGAVSCGRWTQERAKKDGTDAILSNWVLGFLTGVNVYGAGSSSNVPKGTDADGVMATIDSYCAERPLDTLAAACASLVLELAVRLGHP